MTIDAFTNQATAQTTNPVIIPSAAGAGYASGDFNFSYWKSVCLDLAGSGFIITNIKHSSDGTINVAGGWTFGTGGMLQRGNKDAGDHGCPTANYEQAVGSAGTTGNPIDVSHPYYSSETTPVADVNSDTSGVVIDSTSHSAAGKSQMIVLQVKVCYDATQGTLPAKTLTWTYDES